MCVCEVLIDGVRCTAASAREQVDRSDVDAEAATNIWCVLYCEIAVMYIIANTCLIYISFIAHMKLR